MTDDEREMLDRVAETVERIDRALFGVPPGSPEDEKPLIEGLRIMWRAWQRGSWLARALVWMSGIITAMGATYATWQGWWR